MDPYLEAYWSDVHAHLIVYACDYLQAQLPRDLRVHVEEHVTVQFPPDENGEPSARQGAEYPDVHVVEHPAGRTEQSAATATLEMAAPLVVSLKLETRTQRSLRIVDTRSGNRIVTAIEIFSPANKIGERGRAAYRQKQEELLQGSVNLVEIDLLREGHHLMAVPTYLLSFSQLAPYRICVIRACRPDQAEVYQASLRQRLPVLRIPLRESDRDVALALQELVEKSYENGGYDGYIDYRVDPQPPLQGDDAVWADALLREKGRR
jgi:hypothetical protein